MINIISMVFISGLAILTAANLSCPEDEYLFDRWLKQRTNGEPETNEPESLFGHTIPSELNAQTPRNSYHFGSFRLIVYNLGTRKVWFLGMFNRWFYV